MTEQLPNTLTHYYRDVPFHSLSDLSGAEVTRVLDDLTKQRNLEFRLTQDAYLPRRREIEAEMRRQFVELAGQPVGEAPHYAILGSFSLYEEDASWSSLSAPLSDIPSEVVSFTFTDSYFNFSTHNLRGVAIPSRPYHGRVYQLEDLPALVDQFGLPGERWRSEPDRVFDVYVEAQLWDDEVLAAFA